jgi:hypothetical protein
MSFDKVLPTVEFPEVPRYSVPLRGIYQDRFYPNTQALLFATPG